MPAGQGGGSFPLLSTGEVMRGVLSPVLGKHGHIGASPARDDEDDRDIVI